MAIQIRRGSDADWELNKGNIVAGEPAVALDSERAFIGTGNGTFMELATLKDINFVGSSDTLAGTATKVVDCPGFELKEEALIWVNFSQGNTVTSNMMLNVNRTGAIPVYYYAGNNQGSLRYIPLNASQYALFQYDASYNRWWVVSTSPYIAPTPDKVVVTDSSGKPNPSSVTTTELGYLSGANSNIQTQITDLKSELNKCIKSANIYITPANASGYDLNNLAPNYIIAVSPLVTKSQLLNLPFTGGCTIVSTGFYRGSDNSTYSGEIQLAIPTFDNPNNNMPVYRSYTGESWTEWQGIRYNEVLKSSEIYITPTNAGSYDLNNIATNSVICIAPTVTKSQLLNIPYEGGCTIITTGFHVGAVTYGGEIQLAIPTFELDSNDIAYRCYNGSSWSAWKTSGEKIFNATPNDFIEVIEYASKIKGSVVQLSEGVFNLFDTTHNEAYWKNKRPATRYCGLVLSNGITIRGCGDATVINAEYTGTDEDIKENFSAFNISGHCNIENLKVLAENICYCVHDDSGIVRASGSSAGFKNNTFIHNGSDHTFTSGAPICIGGGSTADISREITGNVFSSPSYARPVNYHTGANCTGSIVFSNNYFIDGTIGFNQYISGEIKAIVSNNYLRSNIVGKNASGITCYDWNNIISS